MVEERRERTLAAMEAVAAVLVRQTVITVLARGYLPIHLESLPCKPIVLEAAQVYNKNSGLHLQVTRFTEQAAALVERMADMVQKQPVLVAIHLLAQAVHMAVVKVVAHHQQYEAGVKLLHFMAPEVEVLAVEAIAVVIKFMSFIALAAQVTRA